MLLGLRLQPSMKTWLGFGDYLDVLDSTELGVNVMAFVGHGTIHRAVVGGDLHAGEPDDVTTMAKLVDKCMDEGAGGFSTGLEYFPGILAAPEQLVPLCEVAAKYKRLYATHVRNRDTHYDLGFAGGYCDGASIRRQVANQPYPTKIWRT